MNTPASLWITRLAVFCTTLAVYLFSIGTPFYSSDAQVMYLTSRALALEGTLSVPPDDLPQIVAGHDGRFYSRYDPGLPLLSAPLVYYADQVAAAHAANRYAVGAVAVLAVPALAMALAVTAGTALAQALYGPRRGILVGLVAAFSTLTWPYSRLYFTEAVMAACLTLAVWALARVQHAPRWRVLAASLAMGVGVLTRASMVIYLPALTFLLVQLTPVTRRRWYVGLLWSLPVLAGGLLVAHNVVRFGHPLETGYSGERFLGETGAGAWGILFSPGKSVFLYAPPLLLSARLWLSFRQHYDALGNTLLLLAVSALAFYGSWWAWHGGWVWGPRFLVPLMVVWCLPWGLLPRNPVWYGSALLLVGLGLGVQIVGTFTDVTPHYAAVFAGADPDSPDRYRRIHYQVAQSPLVAGTRRALAGQWEAPALLRLAETGLPAHWATGLPVGVGLVGGLGTALLGVSILIAAGRAPPDGRAVRF